MRLAIVALAVLAACGGEDERARRPVTPLDHTSTGVIRGAVRLDGPAPPATMVSMGGIPECAALHTGPVGSGDVVVHDGAVENAFVYLKEGLGDRVFAVPDAPVVVDQGGCLFRPRVAGAMVGQPIRFTNADAVLHNVHGTPGASSAWNFGLPVKGSERTVRVTHPEVMIHVRCDLHPWMHAYLGVLDHPYFAVTGGDGTFTLADVPPGHYVVAVWHERLGTREIPVTLEPRATAEAQLHLIP